MEAELFANSISQARLDPESEKVTGSGKRRRLTLSRRLRRRSSKRRKMCKAGKGKAEKNTPATRTKKPACCTACVLRRF